MTDRLIRNGWSIFLLACREIDEFLHDISKEEFEENRLLQRAVEKDLEIIGEAASNLSEETMEEFSSIPWKDIIGMRNILRHVYFEVDLEVVWETVENDLPELKKLLEEQVD